MIVTATGTSVPSTVSGAGTTAKAFTSQLQLPGSGRVDGQQFIVRGSGKVVPGVASTLTLNVLANYPTLATGAAQYPTASITSAAMTNNVATYNGTNNFVVGQFVTLANIANTSLNGNVGPLTTVSATSFTATNVAGATLAIANIANVAQTATAAINPVIIYAANASPALTVNVGAPFMFELRGSGDSTSKVVTFVGSDQTVNVNSAGAAVANSSTGTIAPVVGVNLANEPPLFFTVSETFGSSNANNTITLTSLFLEQ